MFKLQCPREAEVIRAAWSGAWPRACDSELVEHAGGCEVCFQAAEFAALFRSEREPGLLEASMPPPGLLWWKAELRRRREAARRASTPILLVQASAAISLLVAGLVVSVRFLAPARGIFDALAAWVPESSFNLPSLHPALLTQPGILMVCAAALLLAPVVIYLALARD